MRFYVLKHRPMEWDSPACTESLRTNPSATGEATICSHCGGAISMRAWLPPFRVELETRGRCFGDLASASGDDILISERFKRLVQDQGVLGLEGFDPVEVVKVRKHKKFKGDPPQYYRVTVKRSQAAIDQAASGFVWDDPTKVCQVCREGHALKRWERIVLEPGTWGGEDVFVARGASPCLCVERFKEICELAHLQNVIFEPAEECWYDGSPWKNFEKAREIMNAPLGPTILEKVKQDGDTWRWETKRNYMIAMTPNGTLRWIDRLNPRTEAERRWNEP